MKPTTLALKNCIIFTVNENNTVILNGTLVFVNGIIKSVGSDDEVQIPSGATVIEGHGRLAILPGLIDAHSHSSLLKGFSENLNLMEWLPVYQREHQVLNEEDAYWAAKISYLEALKGGTTCVLDMYRYMHRCAEAAVELGMRAHLAPYVADHADKTFFENQDNNLRLIQQWHEQDGGRIQVLVGLEHLFYCSRKAYVRAREIAEHYNVQIHTHTSELKPEVDAVLSHFGKLPVHVLEEYGLLCPRTILAHCVWLDASERERLATHGCKIVHCPTSNAKLAGGVAPLQEYKKLGITVGLGSDGSISNNSLSMWESMKFASLLQKNLHYDAAALSAPEVLRLATIEGAKVLGQDSVLGSLEVGKKADLIAVDLWQAHLLPIADDGEHNPILWNLIYAARASDVKHVWVDGRQVIRDGQSTRCSETTILEQAHRQTVDLLSRRKSTHTVALIST